MIYAEIDLETGKCFAISDMAEIESEKLIPLEEFDTSLLGKIWTGSEWIEEEVEQPEPEPEPEPDIEPEIIPTNKELAENQMIIMSALADIAELQLGGTEV